VKTNEQFLNREFVYQVVCSSDTAKDDTIGEFWPIHGLNLVTNQTDSLYFAEHASISDIQGKLRGVATAPDGMTSGSQGKFLMEGRSLANGKPCGDGTEKDYGVVVVDRGNGGMISEITFTHKREHNMDSLYRAVQARRGTLFYLPSVYRNGSGLYSSNIIDKVLVRREVPGGVQIGVIIFNRMVTYVQAIEAITGLDRTTSSGKVISKTTHIYVLDGGPNYGQSCKEVNGSVQLVGTRNATVVTNYLVFY
jgi:hypothetical protein